MNIPHSSRRLAALVIAVAALVTSGRSGVGAQAHHHTAPPATLEGRSQQEGKGGALIRTVREATERYQDVEVAKAEGYALQFGCVSGSEGGAMGMHFVNGTLVGDGELDPTRPEIVIYEP